MKRSLYHGVFYTLPFTRQILQLTKIKYFAAVNEDHQKMAAVAYCVIILSSNINTSIT